MVKYTFCPLVTFCQFSSIAFIKPAQQLQKLPYFSRLYEDCDKTFSILVFPISSCLLLLLLLIPTVLSRGGRCLGQKNDICIWARRTLERESCQQFITNIAATPV
jgi:hypothetical protein